MSDYKTWFELREPGCVPDMKGPLPPKMCRGFMRDLMDARPGAFITVISVADDGSPVLQDGPEWLMMADGRSIKRALRHIASSNAAHAAYRPRGARP